MNKSFRGKSFIRKALGWIFFLSFSLEAKQSPIILENPTFPEGCGKAFQEINRFVDFYNGAISALAAKRGSAARGVGELFAISELRTEYELRFVTTGVESPIDRLLIGQLCQYDKIARQGASSVLKSSVSIMDENLHDHLVSISAKFYADARRLMREAIMQKLKEKKHLELSEMQEVSISKARKLGKAKIEDLLLELPME